MSKKVKGRFAPSPSGRMHLGNLFCALLSWLSARAENGSFLLRIEDLDPDRSKREYWGLLEADLAFLGLDFDEGGSRGGPFAPYFQSERSAYYESLFQKLDEKGLIYPCFCTRAQLHAAQAPHGPQGDPVYSGVCRFLSPEEVRERERFRAPAMRLRVPEKKIIFHDGHYGEVAQNLSEECGDFILRRSDGVFAYQLAVAADDAAMEVTQVVRGRDLLLSTPRQLLLYELLDLPAPKFTHTPLLLSPQGRRLSKRDGDISLEALMKRGFTGEDITGRLAFLAGLLDRPEPVLPKELISVFSWEKVPLEDIRIPKGLFEKSGRVLP